MGGTVELWRQPNITKSETSGVRAQFFIGIGFTVFLTVIYHILHVFSMFNLQRWVISSSHHSGPVPHDFPSCGVGDLETDRSPCEMLKMGVLQLGPP
jgi:hypothetical protein